MFFDHMRGRVARGALLSGAALAVLAAPPAMAQQGTAGPGTEAAALEEIIVTGSRIRRPNIESAVPVTSVGAEEFSATGEVSVGDILNDLPALRSTFSSSNSTRFIGTAGLNLLDLRGLGTSRTLVLQNGRRHVGALEGSNEVDVNMIPTDLIERVDVVTGGSSAVYGSDAVAGVVNFILKDDFEGVQIRAQNGISKEGDANAYFVSATAGKNFDNGKGNLALSMEHARQDDFRFEDRNWGARRRLFVISEPTAGEAGGSDGIPDRLFYNDVRSVLISEGGTVVASCPSTLDPASAAFQLRCKPKASPSDPNVARIFRFRPDGTVSEADYGSIDLRPNANNTNGGDGSTLRRYGQLQPQIERTSINLLAKYEINPAFVPFFEGKYVRNDVIQESSPSFDQGTLVVSIDNPFLTQQARDFLTPRLTAAQLANGFAVNRNNLDLGIRSEDIERTTYRAVVGVRGDFNDDWSYEVAANYGRYEKTNFSSGNRIEQRFQFATDAVRDPATGQIVCRVTIDPAARVAIDPSLEQYLAGDVAGCVPLNPFGENALSQEARDYVMTTSRSDGKQEQFVASGFVTGDLSQLFELPAGPIGFAVGAEYRRQTSYEEYDELVRSGATFLNAIPIFDPPAFEVKEAFGELNIPLLKDLPFAQELTGQVAGRVSDYKGATGTVIAWNAGLTYAPIDDIRFRGNYSKSVRAPDQSELYSAASQNFATVNDPCDVNFISSGSPNRAANCAAAGIPAGFINQSARQQTQEILSGGNPGLKEETSKSWTIGGVLTPTFAPGLSITVDYFDIKVDDVIASVTAQQIVDQCYDLQGLDNAFCALIQRRPAGSVDPRTGEANAFFFVPGGILQSSLNFAKRTAKGVDMEANYTTDLGDFGDLNLNGIATYVKERNNYPDVTDPGFVDQILYELGDPRWTASFSATWRYEGFTLGYQLQYIGKQAISPSIEAIRSVQGRPPTNADYADREFYPDVFYHDIRLAYDVTEQVNLYFGVDNVFDRKPPLDITGVGEFSGIFENKGQYFYAGVIAKF